MSESVKLFGSIRLAEIVQQAAELYLSNGLPDTDAALRQALKNNGVYTLDGEPGLKVPTAEDRRFLAAEGDAVWLRIMKIQAVDPEG